MNRHRLLRRILSGSLNVHFNDMVSLVERFGFRLSRARGSHHPHIPNIPEIVNLQEVNGEAKPYQIRQFLRLVERHNLILEDD